MARVRVRLGILAICAAAGPAGAASVVVHVPHVTAAVAVATKVPGLNCPGTVAGDAVTFADLRPGTGYDARLTLADGTVLQGVDLGWYGRVPDRPGAGPLTDDDRQQIGAVPAGVRSFFNHADVVLLRGDHDRAVMLVDQRRDAAFHSDAGGEVVWRPEVWFFENHHGGWEKVQQTDRVVRRERFPSAAAYHAVADHLQWEPELGGLKVKPGGPDVSVTVTPTTRPAGK